MSFLLNRRYWFQSIHSFPSRYIMLSTSKIFNNYYPMTQASDRSILLGFRCALQFATTLPPRSSNLALWFARYRSICVDASKIQIVGFTFTYLGSAIVYPLIILYDNIIIIIIYNYYYYYYYN
jgi:hypothetical protein